MFIKTNKVKTVLARVLFFSWIAKTRYLFSIFILLFASINPAHALPELAFSEFYSKVSVFGLEFSDKIKELDGKKIVIEGFMAPPLKAEAKFFVLTKSPMAICPFCDSDADWPADIIVVYLEKKQTFVQFNATIEVTGVLEHGVWTDPDTGFVSLLRLRNAKFKGK